MQRDELTELHYIVPIENVPSILARGLLSHRRVDNLPDKPRSVAMPEMQDRRQNVRLPTGRHLHEYVNLYFHARNPMMYKRNDLHQELCVIRISTDVLDIPGTIITDRNAGAAYPRFYRSPVGLVYLDHDTVFAEDWRHPGDKRAYWNHKAIKCAEVLVPDRVGPEYIEGTYVSCKQAKANLLHVAGQVVVDINGHIFFQSGGR